MATLRALRLRPSAKINLTLRVGPRRPDGYHDVQTVLQSIALADSMIVTSRPGPFALEIRGASVPADRSNLDWRAAHRQWRAARRTGDPRGVHVHLIKRIPVAAGLGGGSADAAAALAGLNVIWSAQQSRAQLLNIAAELGADVPFFLLGGTALGARRGDELYPLEDIRRLSIVIVKPESGVATADAYAWLDDDRGASIEESGRAQALSVAWASGPLSLINDLQAPVARRLSDISAIGAAMRRAGAHAWAMSGSGSAVFGVFAPGAATRAVRRLSRPGWQVFATRTLTRREAARRIGL
jgi:4-diphosphocytidyl-2-C-methyl-D-erythritol kinase